jgi:hypothetical protein
LFSRGGFGRLGRRNILEALALKTVRKRKSVASQTYHNIRRGAPIPKADHLVVGVATNVCIRASNSELIILDIVSVCGRNAVYDARSVIILFFIIKPA